MMSCAFCLESARPEYANVFLGGDWPYSGRVIFSHHEAFAVPGYGPQVFPYALIIPRRHIRSLAETTPGEREAIFSCLSFLLSLGIFESHALSVFEHGGCGVGGGNGCLEHCHLHVVRETLNIRAQLEVEEDVEPVLVGRDVVFDGGERYLFAGEFHDGEFINGVLARTANAERQYFRRMIARTIGETRWDWREGMNPHFMRRLMEAAEGCPRTDSIMPRSHQQVFVRR